jgi:hypothetical protein
VRIHLVSPSLATEFTPHLPPFPKKRRRRKFYILLAWALISRNAHYIFHGTKMTITNGFPLSLPQFLFLFYLLQNPKRREALPASLDSNNRGNMMIIY